VAFTYGWDMTLVLLACMPFLAGAATVLTKILANNTKRNAAAYAQVCAIARCGLQACE
jgi:ABC-type bacteriocin/lantibiotic exporter with double-glycine peptidase domain